MDIKDAIRITSECIRKGQIIAEAESFDYMGTVKDALEKQVPKKPTHDGIRHTCPTCHQPLPNVAHSNCMYCGQAIEWDESR